MSWKNLQSSLGSLGLNVQQGVAGMNLGDRTGQLTKSFATLSQNAKERFGAVEGDDVTELPQEYKDLERRVDALKSAHVALLRIAKVYETEAYDYPTQINESLSETASNVSTVLTGWAAAATKGTNIPAPTVTPKAPAPPKTLSHALSRAATSGALEIGPASSAGANGSLLGSALQCYALAQKDVGDLRLTQDQAIEAGVLRPLQSLMNQGIQAAMKSRQNVRNCRLSLDASRAALKSATGGPRQEQARLDVENEEERLVTATEEAIDLMKRVLEDPDPIKALTELAQAQQAYHAKAADRLDRVLAELQDASVKAESEYRKSRG